MFKFFFYVRACLRFYNFYLSAWVLLVSSQNKRFLYNLFILISAHQKHTFVSLTKNSRYVLWGNPEQMKATHYSRIVLRGSPIKWGLYIQSGLLNKDGEWPWNPKTMCERLFMKENWWHVWKYMWKWKQYETNFMPVWINTKVCMTNKLKNKKKCTLCEISWKEQVKWSILLYLAK